ncbi:hypothetical protein [Geminicoccus roseus]|uniref:hypothetical protein n=1 Tax=Geminicoccus roseus TaxID=404900 RepID=UPI000485E875|nr:hypothetical protein [Geminicoccus roseus]
MTGRLLLILSALVLTTLGLNLPNSLAELAMPRFWYLPVEFLLSAALVILAGRRLDPLLPRVLGGVLALTILVRVADRLIWLWMGRELVLATDLELVTPLLEVSTAGWRYLPLALVGALLASMLLLVAWPVTRGLCALTRLPKKAAIAPVLVAALWFVGGPISAFGLDQIVGQVERLNHARAAQERFEQARSQDPWRSVAAGRLFPALREVDVLLVFVESYGRSAFDHPEVAPVARASLARLDAAAAASGKTLVSGYVRSPTLGGQSWLAHATAASGIRTTDQGGWRVYLQEADADLAHLFRRAGHPTFMMQPAIVRPFPEAARLGFDQLLFAKELGYRGPRPGYVTMPDQFTLARVERILEAGDDDPMIGRYGQVALIGSHAPFTPPVPPILPWEDIRDGSVFTGQIPIGLSPALLWSDPPALRSAYAGQIADTIDVVASWAALPAKRPRLAIIMGDHEPAARVLGRDPGYDVPVHVLATSSWLVAPFERAGFIAGAIPDPAAPMLGMEDLRRLLLDGFAEVPQGELVGSILSSPIHQVR